MKLDDKALRCIDSWLSGAYRYKTDAVRAFYPNASAKNKSDSLFHSKSAKEYIEQRRQQQQQDRDSVLSGQRFQWRAKAEGVDSLLVDAGICETVLIPNSNREVFETRAVLIEGMAIPQSAMSFISRLELVHDEDGKSRKAIVAKQLSEKDRLKASELLIRSFGGFTDKQEITGANGNALTLETIHKDMTDLEASEIYKQTVKNIT